MKLVIRGGLSARIVVRNLDKSINENGDRVNSGRVVGGSKKNSAAFNNLNSMLSLKKLEQKTKKVKENISNYEKQSNVVESRLTDLSLMEKSYKAGVENLNNLREECLISGDNEKLQKLNQLEAELKSLHQELVSGYSETPKASDWDEDSQNDTMETPDILSDLESKNKK